MAGQWVLPYVSQLGYLVGTLLLMPGTMLLLPAFESSAEAYRSAISFLIAATSLLTLAATFDMARAVERFRKAKSEERLIEEKIEPPYVSTYKPLLVPLYMLLGGICFWIGSILYWPGWATKPTASEGWPISRVGTWIFRTGTLFYLCGSTSSLVSWYGDAGSSEGDTRERRVLFGVIAYIVGAVAYLIGGIVSEAGFNGFAELWVVGSCFFVAGSFWFLDDGFWSEFRSLLAPGEGEAA